VVMDGLLCRYSLSDDRGKAGGTLAVRPWPAS
jgi:hypothetical protein